MKVHADTQLKAKPSRINIGDLVLVHQRKESKLSTCFDPSPFRVTSKRGRSLFQTYLLNSNCAGVNPVVQCRIIW